MEREPFLLCCLLVIDDIRSTGSPRKGDRLHVGSDCAQPISSVKLDSLKGHIDIDESVRIRRNPIACALELRLFCTTIDVQLGSFLVGELRVSFTKGAFSFRYQILLCCNHCIQDLHPILCSH